MGIICRKRNKSGFTLVELLIVVAIIGVLSTIAVPTFKNMVMKARMTEAKVDLGEIYTIETVFYSEFEAYGSNLLAIGLDIDGLTPTGSGLSYHGLYDFGFPNGCFSCGAPLPSQSGPFAANIIKSNPAYYLSSGLTCVVNGTPGESPGYCKPGSVNATGSTYLATASGVINPKYMSPAFSATASETDQWTMDNDRNLVHFNDGTQ